MSVCVCLSVSVCVCVCVTFVKRGSDTSFRFPLCLLQFSSNIRKKRSWPVFVCEKVLHSNLSIIFPVRVLVKFIESTENLGGHLLVCSQRQCR